MPSSKPVSQESFRFFDRRLAVIGELDRHLKCDDVSGAMHPQSTFGATGFGIQWVLLTLCVESTFPLLVQALLALRASQKRSTTYGVKCVFLLGEVMRRTSEATLYLEAVLLGSGICRFSW